MTYGWFVRGDIDGFFGLFVDNLLQLMLIAVLCTQVCGMPDALVYGRIMPGAALSILFGNAFYTWQARRLAMRSGRTDVTALPYGINTVSLIAYVFLIITAQAFQAVPKRHSAAMALGLVPALAAWALLLIETALRKAGTGLYEVAPKFGGDLYIFGVIALSQGFMLSCMVLAAIMVFVVERQFLKAAAWTAVAALLSFFGVIHAFALTPAGVQNRFAPGAASDFALAYLGAAALLVVLHRYHLRHADEKTGIVA
jgi:hypothetical protein